MNQPTRDIIEFLTHHDLHFGAEPIDSELLQHPGLLRHRVTDLLDQAAGLAPERRDNLKTHLHEVDWPVVAHEFRERINAAASFFDGDAETHLSA